MGRSPWCYVPSFVEIGLLVPEKKIFEGFLPYMGQMPRTNFRSPYLWRYHTKFGFDLPSGLGEEDVWNCGRTDDDDGRTDGRLSLRLRWAKKKFGMTLLHAHAYYICIVCAKYQRAWVKTMVQVDFLMYALSKQKHNPYLIIYLIGNPI